MRTRREPRWVSLRAVVEIQRQLILEHGGLTGPARLSDLEAALARPRHRYDYAETKPSVANLAAAYGYALARAHAFPDGNKRLALTTMDVFLRLNGHRLKAGEVEIVSVMQDLAAGLLSEEDLGTWISVHSRKHRSTDRGK